MTTAKCTGSSRSVKCCRSPRQPTTKKRPARQTLPVCLLVLTVQRVSRTLHLRSRQVQERLAALSDRVQENLSGIQLVKTYAQEDREVSTFQELADASRQSNLALARVRGTLVPLMGSLGGVSSLLAVWAGGHQVATGAITPLTSTTFSISPAAMSRRAAATRAR